MQLCQASLPLYFGRPCAVLEPAAPCRQTKVFWYFKVVLLALILLGGNQCCGEDFGISLHKNVFWRFAVLLGTFYTWLVRVHTQRYFFMSQCFFKAWSVALLSKVFWASLGRLDHIKWYFLDIFDTCWYFLVLVGTQWYFLGEPVLC